MKKKPKYLNATPRKKGRTFSKSTIVLASVALILLLLLMVLLFMLPDNDQVIETVPTDAPETSEVTQAPTEPSEPESETEPVMLENMAALYAQNPDIIGWIRIDGTKLDYPVMYTPDDEEKYLYADFEGNVDLSGLPFIDKDCSMDPESDNLIIYGHNMKNGTAFRTMMSFADRKYWEEHPTIYFSTLYEERTYEILAVFYDRVYKKTENCFKFYQFIDPVDEVEFNEAITYFRNQSLYDTGVTAEFGDRLITLVTCSYQVKNGRFVIVGRQVTDETEVADVTEVAEANP